ncbi:MAG TPA: cytochrome c oxidase subunit II [Candidatus Nanopelagicales bacterium]|nr:cytochrome c oxidase subunit II [Candidatus Nanopelagicales bacterium]
MGSTRSPRPTRARLVALVTGSALVLLGTAGCASDTALGRLGYPEPATEQGPTLLGFWQGAWIAALAVGALTWGLIFWAIIVYRRRTAEAAPVQTRYNLPIEILYTVAPAIMIGALFVFTARDQAEIMKLTPDQKNTVEVVGFKWNWGFNYLSDNAFETGTPTRVAELWLPVNERTRFQLVSPDVIHSFWVPSFLFKMDVVPGRLNQFELTPNKIGTFEGKCAELCGTYHSDMLFTVHVVSREDYEKHIADLKANGLSGKLESGRVVTTGNAGGSTTNSGDAGTTTTGAAS